MPRGNACVRLRCVRAWCDKYATAFQDHALVKSLQQIEDLASLLGRANLTIVSGSGLMVANRIYRAMAMALPWSEFMRQNVTVTPSAGTTAGTKAYDWVKDPGFLNI